MLGGAPSTSFQDARVRLRIQIEQKGSGRWVWIVWHPELWVVLDMDYGRGSRSEAKARYQAERAAERILQRGHPSLGARVKYQYAFPRTAAVGEER